MHTKPGLGTVAQHWCTLSNLHFNFNSHDGQAGKRANESELLSVLMKALEVDGKLGLGLGVLDR